MEHINPPIQNAHNQQAKAKTILVGINDIFFYTKVRDALLPQGYKLEKARAQQDVLEKASTTQPAAVLLDMNDRTVDAYQALETLKTDPRLKTIPVLAYANHEDVDTWNRAKALGVNKIVSRNEMSARTRELVEELMLSVE
ncbi:MAG: response regulator [Nitrospira sp.]|nr:response regulator [Nitrospira sp.]